MRHSTWKSLLHYPQFTQHMVLLTNSVLFKLIRGTGWLWQSPSSWSLIFFPYSISDASVQFRAMDSVYPGTLCDVTSAPSLVWFCMFFWRHRTNCLKRRIGCFCPNGLFWGNLSLSSRSLLGKADNTVWRIAGQISEKKTRSISIIASKALF